MTSCLICVSLFATFASLPFLFHCVCVCICVIVLVLVLVLVLVHVRSLPLGSTRAAAVTAGRAAKDKGRRKLRRYVTCSPYVTLIIVRHPTLLIRPDLYVVILAVLLNSFIPYLPLSNSSMVKNSSASILFLGLMSCHVMYCDVLCCTAH